jgi:4-aminobutyrate aminotransferase/(S)-3-amino-2-methylpropionate transaminase
MSTNAELQRRQAAACAPGAAARGKFIARAENAIIHDVEGRRFIDLTAGIGALNTGHRHLKVMAAAAK